MNRHEHILADPKVAAGKPVVRGTRLAVDFLLELFAKGWTRDEVLKAYPQLTPEALQAAFAFAAEVLTTTGSTSLGAPLGEPAPR
jgi:uncharacterized protein (DUF433 family)